MNQFRIPAVFTLENGQSLSHPAIAYHTYGKPSNPVVWVCHPFHTSSDVMEWWPGLFGPDAFLNPDKYFIICANALGSCYGSTQPLSENPAKGRAIYFHDFPLVTIRDQVDAYESLRKRLKIERIHMLIGPGSGGQQALEWAVKEPTVIENLVLVATNARQSPWVLAINESRRMAIESDITWKKSHPDAGMAGLRAAEALLLIQESSYLSYESMVNEQDGLSGNHKAASFQRENSLQRTASWNAFSCVALSKSADTHHIGRGRGSMAAALAEIQARTMVIGISSDHLYPVSEQRYLAEKIPGAIFREILSDSGHQAWQTEISRLQHLLKLFLEGETHS
ncbi:MAG: alpha/beta fold hydrolase [Bacteroidetes bacterium]|nr:alpha/beta fold hydrolase [Bacteroidota bacterium]